MTRSNWIDSQSDNPYFDAVPRAPQAAPPNFLRHQFRRTWSLKAPPEQVWNWLNDPNTFTNGQIPPYRVEFASADLETPRGFQVGGLNMHHGPGLLASGTLTEIREGEYRDLQYFYGSYVVSVRLVRPTRLQFWLEESANGTQVTMQLDSLVNGWFEFLWELGLRGFWMFFARWMRRI